MSVQPWNDAPEPQVRAPRLHERLRMVLRGGALVTITYTGIVFVVLFNAVENGKPFGIAHRITCLWGTICLWLCGVRVEQVGNRDPGAGAVVANHVGWIDIFSLLAGDGPHFVSKAEVARWPLVGWLSRQIGTVYIERKRSGSRTQTGQLTEKLGSGARLLFFPEGTSTDGQRVLPFKSTLFAAFYDPALPDGFTVQPVSLRYLPPDGLPPAFYGWWGEMGLGPHISRVFSLSAGGRVQVVHHPPLRVADFRHRKDLALAAEAAVRHGVETGAVYAPA